VILCLDIGNSTLSLGLFRDGSIVLRCGLEHGGRLARDTAYRFLKRSLGSRPVRRAAVISVVPPFTRQVSRAVEQLLGASPRAVTVRSMGFMRHDYRSPLRLGVDRLVNAYAAWKLYGAPAVVVDIGTAITWDAVGRHGRYLGGAIAPGPGTMARALGSLTAMLPEVAVRKPTRAVGRNTGECIRSGIYWGTSAMVRELAERAGREAGGRAKTIVTGGAARIFLSEMKGFRYDPDLTLKGIGLACQALEDKEGD
jgi:type III pantothenate kinase